VVGAVVIGRSRAGLTQKGRLSVSTMSRSPQWVVHQFASMLFWPVVLAVWVIRGRPETPWRSEVTPRGVLRVVRADWRVPAFAPFWSTSVVYWFLRRTWTGRKYKRLICHAFPIVEGELQPAPAGW